MLPKKNRLSRKEVDTVFQKGRFISVGSLSFKFFLGDQTQKIAFIVPKSVSKSAVKRNLLRRRGYAVLKKHLQSFPAHINGTLILKTPAEITEIDQKIRVILAQIK